MLVAVKVEVAVKIAPPEKLDLLPKKIQLVIFWVASLKYIPAPDDCDIEIPFTIKTLSPFALPPVTVNPSKSELVLLFVLTSILYALSETFVKLNVLPAPVTISSSLKSPLKIVLFAVSVKSLSAKVVSIPIKPPYKFTFSTSKNELSLP